MPDGGNVTRETFVAFFDEAKNADQMVAEAIAARKDLRKRIKGAGLNLPAFDRSRQLAEMSGDRREEEDAALRQMMAWLNMPLGFQADWVGGQAARSSNGEDITEQQQHQVSNAGYKAGLDGVDRGRNPWTPATALAAIWDSGWLVGQTEIAERLAPAEDAPKRRGRPPGSRNRPRAAS
jgi:hypothetical protein